MMAKPLGFVQRYGPPMQCEACGTANIDGARFCAKCGALMPVEEEGPDPLVGQLIGGRYRVTGVLGEGGMGKVYVGEQQMGSTIRKVAIKTLHQHLSKDPSVLARFHRECGTVAQLEHPNTIKFFDFGSTQDGTLYIAMEFVAGRPLSEVIEKEGPLSPERVVKIMRQVCGVLDEAHLQGVIHRDLKPENIVLTNRAGETDFVKVLDFGIAARTESTDTQKEQKLTQQGMVLGTPPYMSPEQFTGKALDARSDIYSLAVMTYEMLTGKLPFEADTPWQWATQHMTAQPIPFEVSAPTANIPEAMKAAILKGLAKNRDDRQPTARDFFADFSEGARMTVVSNPQHAATGTASMEAMPDFGAAVTAPTAPAAPVAGPAHRPAPTAPGVAIAAPVLAPAPVPKGKQGGGKGLVIGLASLGGLLVVAMAVIAVRSNKPQDEVVVPAAGTGGTTSATIGGPTEEVKPNIESGEVIPPSEPSATASTTTPDPTPTAATTTKPATTGGTTSGTSTGTKTPAQDPCDACLSAAQSGNITSASASYNKCTDAGKKSACQAAARSKAQSTVKTQAFNGQCAQAKATAQAAAAMGIKNLDKVVAQSSCK
jgi:tRNA A-37 threonylcarbamoyl transferase component Bud32